MRSSVKGCGSVGGGEIREGDMMEVDRRSEKGEKEEGADDASPVRIVIYS